MSATIDGTAILVTGANRGIGQAPVTEALRRQNAVLLQPQPVAS
jgi:NAD(P)-dependent dehydrogenase (short-subunit alcohol dehydrogenase family)